MQLCAIQAMLVYKQLLVEKLKEKGLISEDGRGNLTYLDQESNPRPPRSYFLREVSAAFFL